MNENQGLLPERARGK